MGKCQHKTETLVNFLANESYSDYQNIKLVLGYKNKSTIYRLLKKLLTEKKIHKCDYQNKYTLYGLTPLGINHCHVPNMTNAFRVSQLKDRDIENHLFKQKVRHHFRIGEWISIKTSEWKKTYPTLKKPTYLIKKENILIAVELDTKIQNKKGLYRRLDQWKEWEESGLFEKILYVTDDPIKAHYIKIRMKNHVMNNSNMLAIHSIDEIEKYSESA